MNKAIKIILFATAAIMLLAACAQTTPEPGNKETEAPPQTEIKDAVMLSLADAVPESSDEMRDLQSAFNLALLKSLNESQEGNLFYSSMSINAAMTMVYFGAEGNTQSEIAEALGYGGMDMAEVAAYQKYLLQSYESPGDTTFTSANSMWIDDPFPVKEDYINTMKDVFATKVTTLDLQGTGAVGELNRWIDDSTDGMIKKLFEESENPFKETVMVLMNAIYFNGKWTAPFDPDRTFKKQFNGMAEASEVDMMSSDDEVMGYEGEDYMSVMLPYGDDERFAMIAVLPDDMDAFIEGLDQDSLHGVLTGFELKDEALLQMPVFEMEQKITLDDTLKSMGINQAFTKEADLSRISDEDILYIEKVLHKAKIKVDEEGTEAAAVTSVQLTNESLPLNRFEFIADKPFLFFIMDTENDLVLFTGKVDDLG